MTEGAIFPFSPPPRRRHRESEVLTLEDLEGLYATAEQPDPRCGHCLLKPEHRYRNIEDARAVWDAHLRTHEAPRRHLVCDGSLHEPVVAMLLHVPDDGRPSLLAEPQAYLCFVHGAHHVRCEFCGRWVTGIHRGLLFMPPDAKDIEPSFSDEGYRDMVARTLEAA